MIPNNIKHDIHDEITDLSYIMESVYYMDKQSALEFSIADVSQYYGIQCGVITGSFKNKQLILRYTQ